MMRIDPVYRACVRSNLYLGNITVLRHGYVSGFSGFSGTPRVRGWYVAGTWRVSFYGLRAFAGVRFLVH